MCVHNFRDTVSWTRSKSKADGRIATSSIVTILNERPSPSDADVYVEIGGNIGACVFHMLQTSQRHNPGL